MQALGKFALLIVMAAAGLLLLVGSIPWLAHLLHDVPLPGRRIGLMRTVPLASALVLGVALWLYRWLDRRQRHLAEQHHQARLAALREASTGDLLFEAHGQAAMPLLLVPLAALFGFAAWTSAHARQWGMSALLLALAVAVFWLAWHLLAQLLRPGPLLRMDAKGIDHAMYGPIPWRDIVGMQLQTTRTRHGSSHVLMLGVRDAARYLHHAPLLTRWPHRHGARAGQRIGTLPVPLAPLRGNPELIHQSARIVCERAGSPLLAAWHAGMDDKEFDIALRMRTIEEDMGRMAERMQAVPDDADPAQAAELEAQVHAHIARNNANVQALLAGLDAVRDQQQKRLERDKRILPLLRWLPWVLSLGWLLAWVLSR